MDPDVEEALAECEDFLNQDNCMGGAQGSPLRCLSCKRPANDHAPKCRLKWALMVPLLARALAGPRDCNRCFSHAYGRVMLCDEHDKEQRQALAAFVKAVREATGG